MKPELKPVIEVRDLAVSFHSAGLAPEQAVDRVSFTIYPRQTLALVGESGCGKSVTALSILQLVPRPPGRIDRGEVIFDGRDLLQLSEKEMLAVRGRRIAMIFQEPMTSLNPVYTVGDQIIEAIMLQQRVRRRDAIEIAIRAMEDVGIPDARARLRAYPHEFSGGMRQRVMIAMALACQPHVLLADEPTTALDVTIQAQILDLLSSLQESRDLAVLLITHDLGIVAEYADVVCVMYAGRVVEYARVIDLFDRPLHPYTRGLFAAVPTLKGEVRRLQTVEAIVGDPGEFRKLPGFERGVVPWWPAMEPPDDVKPGPRGGRSVLCEVEPNHWVACWRTEHAAAQEQRRPDIAAR